MKHHSILKKKILSGFLMTLLLSSCHSDASHNTGINSSASFIVARPELLTASMATSKKKIKIALLLDTSNSMDGLIDQARAQLWRIVNELALAKCENEKPDLEIALYEYGNSGLSVRDGYVRQVTMFTHDLDLISEKLFSLKTNGGDEYCGYVINSASKELEWSHNPDDLQLIFIAGNEPFNQGPVNGNEACQATKEKGIMVNTIYCGGYDQGVSEGWKSGAVFANGNYMSIEQDKKTVYIETPYDKEIGALNDRINSTYIGYGIEGDAKAENQKAQDKNAGSYSTSNMAERVKMKTTSVYNNATWDLVDASKQKGFDLEKLDDTQLPKELKGKTSEEKKQYIAKKQAEREAVIKEISVLNSKRSTYISEKTKSMSPDEKSLDAVMIKAIRKQAAEKNFVFEQ